MAIACIAYARLYLSKKYYQIPNEDGEFVSMPYQEPTYEDTFKMEEEGLPSTLQSFLPLIVPIVLILINTIASALGKTTGPMEILIFLGQPIVAVGLGLLVAIFGLGRNLDRHTALSEMEKGMMSAGIIMLVTGGGGALGQIIKDSGLGTYIAEGLSQTAIPIIILPLIIYLHTDAFHSGLRYSCNDNSSKYLCSYHRRFRCQPSAGQHRLLRRLPVLRLLQR